MESPYIGIFCILIFNDFRSLYVTPFDSCHSYSVKNRLCLSLRVDHLFSYWIVIPKV